MPQQYDLITATGGKVTVVDEDGGGGSVAPLSSAFWVDGWTSDASAADGSIARPFASVQAAVDHALGRGLSSFALYVSLQPPGETSVNLTFPPDSSCDCTILGLQVGFAAGLVRIDNLILNGASVHAENLTIDSIVAPAGAFGVLVLRDCSVGPIDTPDYSVRMHGCTVDGSSVGVLNAGEFRFERCTCAGQVLFSAWPTWDTYSERSFLSELYNCIGPSSSAFESLDFVSAVLASDADLSLPFEHGSSRLVYQHDALGMNRTLNLLSGSGGFRSAIVDWHGGASEDGRTLTVMNEAEVEIFVFEPDDQLRVTFSFSVPSGWVPSVTERL